MKIRKALDKAKGERRLMDRPVSIGSLPAVEKGESRKKTWKPPEYTDSRMIELDADKTERNRGICIYAESKEIEQYKILRSKISQHSKRKSMRNIMITSPNAGEGKTTTCINMGLTFARELNHTVFLVDCDFKGQDIHRYLGIDSKHSLIDYFLDDIPLVDLIIWPGVEKLTLVSGDRTVFDASELLSSEMMATLVKEMGNRYADRYIIYDAPPVLERSEAISLAPLMDGIIMVVEAGVTSQKDVLKAVELLPEDKFLGFVLNRQG